MALSKIAGPCRAISASMRAAVRFECFCGQVVEFRRDTSTEKHRTTIVCDCGLIFRMVLSIYAEPSEVAS